MVFAIHDIAGKNQGNSELVKRSKEQDYCRNYSLETAYSTFGGKKWLLAEASPDLLFVLSPAPKCWGTGMCLADALLRVKLRALCMLGKHSTG